MTTHRAVPLEPCPHCGSEAKFYVSPPEVTLTSGEKIENPDDGGEFIQCTNTACAASSMLIFPTMADAKPLLIEKWNRRTAPADSSPEPVAEEVLMSGVIYREVLRLTQGIQQSFAKYDAIDMLHNFARFVIRSAHPPAALTTTTKEPVANCSNHLRLAGKAYPRTCQVCGLGPCRYNPVDQAIRAALGERG